jgi:PhzF family phenazine biosynthesis protein
VGLEIYQVDAFTGQPFKGNPAGVCILAAPRESAWMQNVAREMNLSETAFLHVEADAFSLRWFTPAVEVELCGHATLASAHILFETGRLAPEATARFRTLSGMLAAARRGAEIELDFPATLPEPAVAPEGLAEALGVAPRHVARSRFDYLVEVGSEDDVRRMQPDFRILKTLPVRGVIVTSRASSGDCDFVSRFFAPGAGIDEDPVTGSAHCCLGPFWSRRLGKTDLVAFQASERGGLLRVRVAGERVRLAGRAVTVIRGELVNV